MKFRNNEQRAIAYAAYKALEKALKSDGQIPHGAGYDLSGKSITITLPESTYVSRDAGVKGDGVIEKTATQNLYGWTTIAFFVERLKRFNQAHTVYAALKDTWTHVLSQPETKVKTELVELDPQLATIVEELKKKGGPKRPESTPRNVDFPARVPVGFSFDTADVDSIAA
jgi:hypothetical protein